MVPMLQEVYREVQWWVVDKAVSGFGKHHRSSTGSFLHTCSAERFLISSAHSLCVVEVWGRTSAAALSHPVSVSDLRYCAIADGCDCNNLKRIQCFWHGRRYYAGADPTGEWTYYATGSWPSVPYSTILEYPCSMLFRPQLLSQSKIFRSIVISQEGQSLNRVSLFVSLPG
jgi:hypothetical protein